MICRFRAILFNDSYEPVSVMRNDFVGPSISGNHPEAVEPDYGYPQDALVLQPFTFYGREREHTNLSPGELKITAYYKGPDGQKEIVKTRKITVSKG